MLLGFRLLASSILSASSFDSSFATRCLRAGAVFAFGAAATVGAPALVLSATASYGQQASMARIKPTPDVGLPPTATITPNWTQQSPATSPSARWESMTAYDAATGQVVLFGGYSSSAIGLGDTWTYNGATWTQQSPASSPSARRLAPMAYDAATGQVVLFGGYTSAGVGDTWTYNGTTWTQQSPATSPPARYGASMVYDTATGLVVLFGGENSGSTAALNDTWTYNGTTWTQQSPATSPPSRYVSTMVYDAATGQVVLFGGNSGGGTTFGDTWTYNGTTWTQQSPATSPTARYFSTMAYDPATAQVVLFGGSISNGTTLGDTWTYNGTTWTQQSPATSPSARYLSTAAYDAASSQMVLFGGDSTGGIVGDTWTYQAGAAGTPTSPVSTAATQTPVYFLIGTGGTLPTLSNSNVLTQGTTGLDFTLGTGSTCTGAVTAAQTCTVNVAFTPSYPGQRLGAVNLLSTTGTLIATGYISGTGTGPLATFTPGLLSTVAGTGTACSSSTATCGDGSAATASGSNLYAPAGVAVDSAGNLYIADEDDNRIRKVTAATGILSTVAGTGTACTPSTATCGDGNAATASGSDLNLPLGVAVDGAGNLYISDRSDNRIRKVTVATGILSTVAGNGTPCASSTATCGDGGLATASGANLDSPFGLAVDGAGNLYIADRYDDRIRKVTAATGILSTVAGTGTPCASSTATCGDGTAATASGSNLNSPVGVAVDGAGNLYIADFNDNRIRMVSAATGIISTVAGTGNTCSPTTATCGDGSAATASGSDLSFPTAVAVDSAGNLYIADQSDNRIRKVTAATGILSTVAGSGTQCAPTTATCGDGSAATASSSNLNLASDVVVDGAGNLYIADQTDNRIRKVTATTPALTFPDTAVNATSASQTVILNNIGNTALTVSVPTTGQNPSLASNFSQSASSTCPLVYTNSSAGTLVSGASCTEILSYAPTISGATTGGLVFTDNNLNVSAATQTITLIGATSAALTVTAVSQLVATGSATVILEFTVGYGGNAAPTATPTLTVNGSNTNVGTITCTTKNGHNNCTATYNASSLANGTYTILATQPADSNYATTTGSATLTITATGHLRTPTPILNSKPTSTLLR